MAVRRERHACARAGASWAATDRWEKLSTMADACPGCGADRNLVGRQHRCVPRAKPVSQTDVAKVEPMAKNMAKVDMANMAKNESDMAKTTYRYRDVEKRRAYMRELMRERYKKAK
jgi:hypothetical protein